MLRFVRAELRTQRTRALALAVAILLSSAGFLLLASSGKTTDVRVQGSVRSNFRAAYDILVRPRSSTTRLERSRRLVRPNYLSGIFGGITLRQYDEIKRLPRVEVAAPVANLGYILPFQLIPFVVNDDLTRDPVQLYRIRSSWSANAGLSTYPAGAQYVYYTRRDRFVDDNELVELVPGHKDPLPICQPLWGSYLDPAGTKPKIHGPFDVRQSTGLTCYSERSPETANVMWPQSSGILDTFDVGSGQGAYFPIFVSAIDPVQEARLVGLDHAIVGGRYLREGEAAKIVRRAGLTTLQNEVPVVASTRSFSDDALTSTFERLRIPPGTDVPARLASNDAHSFLAGLSGRQLRRERFTAAGEYQRKLERGTLSSHIYWQTTPTRYDVVGADELRPLVTTNPAAVWRSNVFPDNGGFLTAPPANRDVQFRRIKAFSGSNRIIGNVLAIPSLRVVGRFDPAALREFGALSRVPLETYYPPTLEAADARSKQLLHGKPLSPTQNVGDYVQQPPLILTTLRGIKPYLDSQLFAGASAKAPISVIRVRVAGVRGPDDLSIARIRSVAAQIRDRTSLDVDITAGSSPHPMLIDLPAGKFGRPPLTLREGWSKKGVSVSFLKALDRKRLGLLALVLVACGVFLANGAYASVRARRVEIGTLLTLGWSPGAIFTAILGELLLIAVVAGVVGAGVALGVARALGLELSVARALLVIPLALLLALAAGLWPAWRAARVAPLDAVRPAIAGSVRGGRVRSLGGLALVNLRRVPARSLVALVGLFVGVAALTLLIAINRAFQGSLVGTLLGNAISLQVRTLDFLSVALIIGLAGLSLADVLFLSLRERSAELATLRTVGWEHGHIGRVVVYEAATLGTIGSLAGAVVGLSVGGALGVPLGPLALAAVAATAGGVAVALLASLLPVSRIGRLAPTTLLAEE